MFDKDNSGFISQEELRRVMINLGGAPTNDEVAEMIREEDLDGDGLLNFEDYYFSPEISSQKYNNMKHHKTSNQAQEPEPCYIYICSYIHAAYQSR